MDAPLLILEHDPIAPPGPDEILSIAGRIGSGTGVPPITPGSTVARRFALPFYRDVTLLEMTDPSWRPPTGRLCFLEHGDLLARLDGTSPPIHAVNKRAEIVLSRATVLPYLAFFCFFVRGEDGPFLLVDRVENPFLPTIAWLEELKREYRIPLVWGQSSEGSWRASALIYYSSVVFASDFVIDLSGMVTMVEDQPVLKDFDERVDAPITFEVDTIQ